MQHSFAYCFFVKSYGLVTCPHSIVEVEISDPYILTLTGKMIDPNDDVLCYN